VQPLVLVVRAFFLILLVPQHKEAVVVVLGYLLRPQVHQAVQEAAVQELVIQQLRQEPH
jgi:hypothetical protein